MTRSALAALGMTMGFAVLASAQDTVNPRAVQPERPTVATHAGTVAPGYFEIETGFERDQSGGTVQLFNPDVFKFGLASHAQLSLTSALYRDAGTSGAGDFEIGVKWRLIDDAPILGDFAIFPAVKLSTGSIRHGSGTGTTDASLLLISSHMFGNVAMDLNAGYVRRSGPCSGCAPRDATVWTASFGGPFAGRWGWVAEAFGYPGTGGPTGQAPTAALLVGPTARIRDWLAVDAGVIVPLTGPQPHALYLGGVYNVGRLW